MDQKTKTPNVIILKCPDCGGNMELDAEKETATCPYCHTKILIPKSVEQNNVVNNYYEKVDVHIEGGEKPKGEGIHERVFSLSPEQIRAIRKLAAGAAAALLVIFVFRGIIGLFKKKEPVSPPVTETGTEAEKETQEPAGEEASASSQQEDSGGEQIDVPEIARKSMSADPLPEKSGAAEACEKRTFTGSIRNPDQEEVFSLNVPNKGSVTINVSELVKDTSVSVLVYNESGDRIAYDYYARNNKDIVFLSEEPDRNYEIRVKQKEGYPDFKMTVNLPRPVMEIGDYTVIADEIGSTGQINEYRITAKESGRYYFGIEELMADTSFDLFVFDKLGSKFAYRYNCRNGEGVNAMLEAGETYLIQVCQRESGSSYNMVVGKQKKKIDISEYTDISDEIAFTGQTNSYCFTAPSDGRYRVELSEINAKTKFIVTVYNKLDEKIGRLYTSYMTQNGVTIEDLKAGEEYRIYVEQDDGLGTYHLSLFGPKDTVAFTEKDTVCDKIEYTEQRNTYSFTAERAGNLRFVLKEIEGGCAVRLIVYDDLDKKLGSAYCRNDGSLALENVEEGEHFTVFVEQAENYGSYVLTAEQ